MGAYFRNDPKKYLFEVNSYLIVGYHLDVLYELFVYIIIYTARYIIIHDYIYIL